MVITHWPFWCNYFMVRLVWFNGATTGGFSTNVTVVIINTLNGGAFGLITSIVLSYIFKKKLIQDI